MKYYKCMQEEKRRLDKAIQRYKSYISKAPKGRLQCYRDRQYYKWRLVTTSEEDGNKQIRRCLKKKEERLAKALAVKGLYEKELLDLEQERKAIEKYLKSCCKVSRAAKYLERNPEIRRLAEPSGKWNELQERWLSYKHEGEVPFPENRTKPSRAGYSVRSKSEQIISEALYDNGIPAKYEEPLDVSEAYTIIANNGIPFAGKKYNKYYPDFTLLNPRTGEEILWEHFGMMDDPYYAADAANKILVYSILGYQEYKNIIYTYEENNSGVDGVWIEQIINHYFK